jgi:hypothetical protein
MNSHSKTITRMLAACALWAGPAMAQTFNHGDLLLGVQATGGTGDTTNVFVNLGSAGYLNLNNPNQGYIKNINDELVAAFGANWFSRTDLHFGVIANRSNNGTDPEEYGDPSRTFYISQSTTTPGGSTAPSGYTSASLGAAGVLLAQQIDAVNILPSSNGVVTMTQGANPAEWTEGWSARNPVPGDAYELFNDGIQNNFGKTGAAYVDLYRLVPDAAGTYVTTIAVTSTGNVMASATFHNLNLSSDANGSVSAYSPSGFRVSTGANVIALNTTVYLSTTPNSGYVFDEWTDDFAPSSPTSSNIGITMDGVKTLGATFKIDPPSLTIDIIGGIGDVTVKDGPATVDRYADEEPGAYTYDVSDGTVLSLTPVPYPVYEFVRWEFPSGPPSYIIPQVVTMDDDKTVTAVFSSTSSSNVPGFTQAEINWLNGLQKNWMVGYPVDIDLGRITLATGQTLSVLGLPKGLSYDASTRRITGTPQVELGETDVIIRINQGSLTVGSVVFGLSINPYAYLGGYEALVETAAGKPMGKVRLNVTGPNAASATLHLENENGSARSAKGLQIVFGTQTGTVLPVTINFPAGRNNIPAAASMGLNLDTATDAVLGSQTSTTNTLRGFRLARPGRAPRQAVTVAFSHSSGGRSAATPAGYGFATGSASGTASLSLKGSLGDAQAFTTALAVSHANQAVVWIQPYKDKTQSFLGGILEVGNLGSSPRDSNGSGYQSPGLKWAKLNGIPGEKAYLGGFGVPTAVSPAPTAPIQVSGSVSKWYPVTTAEGLAQTLGLNYRNISVYPTDAPTTTPPMPLNRELPTILNLRNKFTLVSTAPSNAVPWVGKAVPATGTFNGTLTLDRLTLTTAPVKGTVSGALFQDGSMVGIGWIKVPTSTAGHFETVGITLYQ